MYDEFNFPDLPITWTNSSVEETYETISFQTKIPTTKYLSTGKLAVIDQSANFVGGYIDDPTLAVTQDLPVIVFGDHTRIIKFIDFPFAAGADGIKVFKPKDFFYPRLYYFFLQSIKLPNKGYARHFQYLRSSKIPIPPLKEQKRIADKLDILLTQVDSCREHLDRVPEILKRFRQAVLSAAVSGKLTEDWRKNNESINHWEQKTIGDVTENAKQYKPNSDEEFFYIDIASIDKDQKKVINPQKYLGKDAPSRARQVVQAGDVLVSMTRPNLNSVALIPNEFNGQIASTGFDVLRPKNITPEWLFLLVRTDNFVAKMTELVQGALYPAIRPRDIRNYSIPLPSVQEQNEIMNRVNRLLGFANRLEKHYQTARSYVENLTPSLLTKAFSGKLVPQDPNDEPAKILIERIRSERQKAQKEIKKSRRRLEMNKSTYHPISVIKALNNSNGKISTKKLFQAAGYPLDAEPEDVEAFFVDLRDSIQNGKVKKERIEDEDYFSLFN